MQSTYLTVDGVRTHLLHAGEGGDPVLLLHGGAADFASLSWGALIEPLAQTHRVFAADWPGFGESGPAPEPSATGGPPRYSNQYHVNFLCRLMEALDLPRASLVGISMGGAIALGFTLHWPERVDRLVLLDSYGLQRQMPPQLLSALFVKLPLINELTWALLRRSRALTAATVRRIFTEPRRFPESLIDELFAAMQDPGFGQAWMQYQRHETGWHGMCTYFMDELHRIEQPVLLIHGAQDNLVPLSASQEAARRLPDARLEVIPGCGHWPQREHPELVNPLIIDFLNREAPARGAEPAG